jgi:hypothetical protein
VNNEWQYGDWHYGFEIPAVVVIPADESSSGLVALGNGPDPMDVAGSMVATHGRIDLGVQGATTAGSGVEAMSDDTVSLNPPIVNNQLDSISGNTLIPVDEFVADLDEDLVLIRRTALEMQQSLNTDILSKSPLHPSEFEIGCMVLVSANTRPMDKLTPRWMGPMQVMSRREQDYTLRNVLDNGRAKYFINRLKLYNSDPLVTDVEAALLDANQYLVEKIISFTGNPKKVSTLKFKVKWVGYDREEDLSIEPWSEMKKNVLMEAFVRKTPRLAVLIDSYFSTPAVV